MKRTIAAITSSRADYGHLFWPLRELQARDEVDLRLIAFGAHLAPEFGETVDEIVNDGFRVDERIECLVSSDSDVGMAKTIGVATQSLADALGRMRPDLLLVIADRYEMLAPASVALALRIPIAHIEGGDRSEGAIDNAVRNALTMMSHIHLAPSALSRQRIIAMGEEPWRVHFVGAPSLDHLVRSPIPAPREVSAVIGLDTAAPTLVVSMHPTTLALDTTTEADALFEALGALDEQLVFCFPNSDAGTHRIQARAREFCARRQSARLMINLPHLIYWGLLHTAVCMIGNSSSGIMETPSIPLPTVNVGDRQRGRERARNVIDVSADAHEILQAVATARSDGFRESLAGMQNPYGSGNAGRRIADVLATVALDDRLLRKETTLLNEPATV